MDDFYNKIKRSVDGVSEENSSQSDWNSFQSFRDKKNATPSKPFPWLMASTLGLIALLIGSNIYWANRSFDSITSNSTITLHDTIYITKIVDNSYQTLNNSVASLEAKIQEKEKSLENYNLKYKSLQSQYNLQERLFKNLHSNYNLQKSQLAFYVNNEKNKSGSLTTHSDNLNEQLLKNNMEKSLLAFSHIPTLSIEELDYKRSNVKHSNNVIWIDYKKPFNLKDAIKPKTFSLNANVGIMKNIDNRLSGAEGSVFSLYASTLFSKHIRGSLGINTGKVKAYLLDENYPNIPTIEIPEDYTLKESQVIETSLLGHARLDYIFTPMNRFRPYAGLGVVYQLVVYDQFSFELKGMGGETYITPENKFDVLNSTYLSLSLGTDFNLYKSIDLSIGATYMQPNSSKSKIMVNTGIYYHF